MKVLLIFFIKGIYFIFQSHFSNEFLIILQIFKMEIILSEEWFIFNLSDMLIVYLSNLSIII